MKRINNIVVGSVVMLSILAVLPILLLGIVIISIASIMSKIFSKLKI